MPYFFTVGHMNYTRYMTWNLRNVGNMPTAVNKYIMKGAHVCRHSDGGMTVPVDQFGQQTYSMWGKVARGLR